MGLNSRLKAHDTCRALDHVMDKSKSEQRGEERSRCHGHGIMDKKRERSEQGEKAPDRSEDEPSGGLGCGDHLNVPEVESLVAFDQNQLFNQEQVVCPEIKLGPQAWKQGHKQAATGELGVGHSGIGLRVDYLRPVAM